MKGHKHMDEQRASRLLGSPERRIAVRDIEVRAGTGSTYVVRGYACVTDHAYDVYGGAAAGGWSETVQRGAFDTTLAAKPDVCFLLNHEGAPLARSRSGTLMLRADNTGLESEATVDRRDPEGQALEIKMERGDLDQMSFGFRVTRQAWNEDYTERDIIETNLDNGDVSVVNWPANPATSMSIVSARSALAVLGEMELSELRSELGDITPDELRAAQQRLASLIEGADARASVSIQVCTDDEDDDYSDPAAADDESTEPALSDLVALAVNLLTQAATGLQALSATDDGKERADAVVRRFAQLLTVTAPADAPVVIPDAEAPTAREAVEPTVEPTPEPTEQRERITVAQGRGRLTLAEARALTD